jgi:hypothetical protein
MAVCPECGKKHYNPEQCPNCGSPVYYKCWNCHSEFRAAEQELCHKCHWFICPYCGECGCNSDRPKTMEEKGKGWVIDESEEDFNDDFDDDDY